MVIMRGLVVGALLLACVQVVEATTLLKDNLAVRTPEYLPPTLRVKVDKLRREVVDEPTTTRVQLRDRSALLWTWANAYALTGRAIHPELPSMIARATQGDLTPRSAARFGPILDWLLRELSFQDANPGAIGFLTSDFLGPYEVAGYGELRQTYTVGSAPIEVGGGFLVATRSYSGPFVIQTDDPAADGWVTVTSSNPAVFFETSTLPVSGMFSGSLGGSNPRPYFKVSKGVLLPGDRVTIVAGDQS